MKIKKGILKSTMLNLSFRPLEVGDWNIVSIIYSQGIETNDATFQKEVPSWSEWDKGHLKNCRIIVLMNKRIAGWAALTPISDRSVYSGVAEVSIYIARKFRGLNIGKKLLERMILESEQQNIWTLQAGIFPENLASIKIHKDLGFRVVGYRERIGLMNGRWRDIILMERRSKKVN